MRLSQAGIGKTRLQNIDKMYLAQDILLQSGQIVQYSTGIYAYNNVPLKVKQKIENIVKEELTKCGCVEIELPTLKGEYCLAPTAEEAVVEFAKRK